MSCSPHLTGKSPERVAGAIGARGPVCVFYHSCPMNSKLLLLPVALLGLGVVDAFAKRQAPKDVPPITFQGVKYSAPHWGLTKGKEQNGGYIEAVSFDTGKLLWDLRVYEVKYDSGLERDIQDVFITSLKLVDGNLEVLSEAGDKFVVDVAQRRVIVGAGHVYRFKGAGR
jgi:hypothetical protein